MEAPAVFAEFVRRVLVAEKADRFIALCASKKGQKKILSALNHQFEPAILPKAVRFENYDRFWEKPCFVFHSLIFGARFDSLREAYEKFSIDDGWLIILCDGSVGIHRPEARWDDEKLIG